MMTRRKALGFGAALAAMTLLGHAKSLSFLFRSPLNPFDKNKPLTQVVVIRSESREYDSADQLKTEWDGFVVDNNLSFSDLCELRNSGAFLSEERMLLDSRTLQTVRTWKSSFHFEQWILSQQRKSLKTFLENNSRFSLVQETVKILS